VSFTLRGLSHVAVPEGRLQLGVLQYGPKPASHSEFATKFSADTSSLTSSFPQVGHSSEVSTIRFMF